MALIPKCTLFVEPFAGSGAVANKVYTSSGIQNSLRVPVKSVWLNDVDPKTVSQLRSSFPASVVISNYSYKQVLDFLIICIQLGLCDPESICVYMDPPYLLSTRRNQASYYKFEMSDRDHVEFLNFVISLPFRVIISGYASQLYDSALDQWHRQTHTVALHKGTAQEILWCNFKPGSVELFVYSYLGSNNSDRQRIKRKRNNALKSFVDLPQLEINALLRVLSNQLPK